MPDEENMTDAERADDYLHLIARIRDAALSIRDDIADEWFAECMGSPSSVAGLVEARMKQLAATEKGAAHDRNEPASEAFRRGAGYSQTGSRDCYPTWLAWFLYAHRLVRRP